MYKYVVRETAFSNYSNHFNTKTRSQLMTSEVFISEKQRLKFKPTYLMIKQHEISGVQYLCKTVRKDPIKYKGSGTFWMRHIKVYGTHHVKTIWFELFTDIDELVSTALALSENFDVVNSSRWANLKPENGLDGFESSNSKKIQVELVKNNKHHLQNKEAAKVRADARVASGTHNWQNKTYAKERELLKLENGTHHFLDSAYQSRVSRSGNAKRIQNGTHNAIQESSCPHCGKSGKGIAMFRHHFDRCKYKDTLC